ncbi:hypothetical protein F3Y22_tig00111392pilonHSYRG00555 [Hibiscus syriacus]|uniref:Cytochrome P450 71D10 n=1 Tax=Hibiscus syriacus TaxID=106335 RepID=A0A6A2YLQ2_HIBSY|nr:hypothetical protein F3Y22_tig00111392pilonHSYRG00555 [Hibiscus syriacus]
MLVRLGKRFRTESSTPNLPPGPWKLPVIGSLHLLAGPLPHQKLRDMAEKYGSLMHLQLGQLSNIVVSSPQTAAEVMRTHDIIFSIAKDLCAGDVKSKTCAIVHSDSGRRGIEAGYSNFFKSRITSQPQEVLRFGAGFNVADLFPSAKLLEYITGLRPKVERLHQNLDKIFESVIDEHKASKGIEGEPDGLVDVLLNLQENGDLEFPLTTDNIKAVIMDIFIAGSDTSFTTLEWAMSEMLKTPRVMQKAQAEVRQVFNRKGNVDSEGLHELEYLKLVISETFRLHPPLPLLLPRECSQGCKINGYDIPVKSRVIVNAWAIGRNSEYWDEAERFYPERFINSSVDYKGANFELIPFGAGRRMCPGMLFGIANVELPLAKLLYHFDWKLAGGRKLEDLDMDEVFGAVVRRKNDLCLVPTPYSPVAG